MAFSEDVRVTELVLKRIASAGGLEVNLTLTPHECAAVANVMREMELVTRGRRRRGA